MTRLSVHLDFQLDDNDIEVALRNYALTLGRFMACLQRLMCAGKSTLAQIDWTVNFPTEAEHQEYARTQLERMTGLLHVQCLANICVPDPFVIRLTQRISVKVEAWFVWAL